MKPISRKTGRDATAGVGKPLSDPARAAQVIRRRIASAPRLGLILGSGFRDALSTLELEAEIPYARLPGFPIPTVAGHEGRLLAGKLGGAPVLILSGRAHFYEGHDMSRVTFGVRVLAACGIADLLLTNAAGGIASRLKPGDLMVLDDHINLMGTNPLRDEGAGGLPRFVDLTNLYDREMSAGLRFAGKQCGLKLKSGVYLAVTGPSYETPAEIRAFAALGADAVGMSTVPEAIVARQCGLRVAGLSCITNLAAGRSREPLSHAEVLDTARRVQAQAARLLETFASLYAPNR